MADHWQDVQGTWEDAAGRWAAMGDDVMIVERIGDGLCLTVVHVADGARSSKSSVFPGAEALLARLMPPGRPLAVIDLPEAP